MAHDQANGRRFTGLRRPADLVQAIEAELAARSALEPACPLQAAIVSEEVHSVLKAHVQLCDHNPRAKPGFLSPLWRGVWKVLHVLIRPWLQHQTIYNDTAERSLTAIHAAVVQLRQEVLNLRMRLGIESWGSDPQLAQINILHALRNEIDYLREQVASLSARIGHG